MDFLPADPTQLEQLVNEYLFFPPRAFVAEPAQLGLPYENIWLATEDGVKVHGWFIPNLTAGCTLLCLHGNADNISYNLPFLKQLFDAGLQIFALDYRGYGRSEGAPSEQGTYRDALAAWQWLRDEIGGPVALFGHSLGGAVSLWLASQAEVDTCAVVVEGTFTRLRDLAAQVYPIPGLAQRIPDLYPSVDRAARLRAPLLVIHGTADELIPLAQGERLFAAAPGPKQMLRVPGAGHNDLRLVAGRSFVDALVAFLREHCAADGGW